jgi:ABC-type anion transport system duplicated permease subunit
MSIRSLTSWLLFAWLAGCGAKPADTASAHPAKSDQPAVAPAAAEQQLVRIGYQKIGTPFLLKERAEGLQAVTVVFPVYLNTFHGVRSVDPQLVEMARTYRVSGFTLYREIILPGALPSILVGLRFALGLAWLVLIVAETIGATQGLGYVAMNAREFMQMDMLVLTIVLWAMLGKLADVLARALERRLLPWLPRTQRMAAE